MRDAEPLAGTQALAQQDDPGKGAEGRELRREHVRDGHRSAAHGEVEAEVRGRVADAPRRDPPRLGANRGHDRARLARTGGDSDGEQERERAHEQEPPPDAELARDGRPHREHSAPAQRGQGHERHATQMRPAAVAGAGTDEHDARDCDDEQQGEPRAQALAAGDRDDRRYGSLAREDRRHHRDGTGLEGREGREVGRDSDRRGGRCEQQAASRQVGGAGREHHRRDQHEADRERSDQDGQLADATDRDCQRDIRHAPAERREQTEQDGHRRRPARALARPTRRVLTQDAVTGDTVKNHSLTGADIAGAVSLSARGECRWGHACLERGSVFAPSWQTRQGARTPRTSSRTSRCRRAATP